MSLTRRELLLGGAVTAAAAWPLARALASDGPSVAVDWMWVGGVTDTEATVVAKLDAAAGTCRLKVSLSGDLLTDPIYSDAVADDANGYVKMTATGLTAGTHYNYGIEIDASVDALRGRFRTFPAVGSPVANFKVAFGSCSADDTNHRVFETIRFLDPLMFIHLGDFHYADIATNDEDLYRAAIEAQMAQPYRAEMHRSIANAYVWDDHDYGADDSDGTSVSRAAAAAVYRQTVPHFPLAASGNTPIYQSWRIGRVRFILTDLRHARSPNSDTDDASKTMMGATQKAWFKAQLDAARDSDDKLIVWCNSQVWRVDPPFTGIDTPDGDHWGSFSTERAELANYIADNEIPQVMILGGDAHMIAFDDGRASDYSDNGGAEIPVFHASPLDEGANTRGTDWMSGTVTGTGHYGVLTVTDDGQRIAVYVRANRADASTGVAEKIKEYHFAAGPWGNRPAKRLAS